MVTWRSHIEALAFQPAGRQEDCVVHRRAFRTLLGFDPSPEECEAFFRANRAAFEAAASAKVLEKDLASGVNFHLTSRDVARQLRLATRCPVG
jgi:hypothetical protein